VGETNIYTWSPMDVIWNSSYTDATLNGFSDTSDVIVRKYGSLFEACDEQIGNTILGLELIAYLIPDDEYHKFSFSGWTSGGNGGGFSYTRELIPTPASTWTAFTKPNSGDTATYKDELSSYLHITRDLQKGIYNSVSEVEFDNNNYLSPSGSSWNSSYTDGVSYGWGDLTESNITGRTYGTWTEANDQYPSDPGFQELEMVLYDPGDDQYYQIQFRQWTQGPSGNPAGYGGGFRYIRKDIYFGPPPTPSVTPTVTPSSVTPTPTPSITVSPTPSPSPIPVVSASEWSLPGAGEWGKIEDLYAYGVFTSGQTYWTSTEYDSDSVTGASINGVGVNYTVYDKNESHLTRPYRTFSQDIGGYSLYDVGPLSLIHISEPTRPY